MNIKLINIFGRITHPKRSHFSQNSMGWTFASLIVNSAASVSILIVQSWQSVFYQIVNNIKYMNQLKRTQAFSFIAVVFISAAVWHMNRQQEEFLPPRILQTYATSTTRLSLNTKMCEGIARTSLLVASGRAKAQANIDQFKSIVPVDGNVLVNQIVEDSSKGIETIMEYKSNLIVFIGSMGLGFLFTMLCCFPLSCCCCCPNCCPPSCCRQPQELPYTRCQLMWPTVTLVLALLLTIGASSYGIANAGSFTNGFSSFACSVSMLPDDLLYGNVTDDGNTFFTGISTMQTLFGDLLTNLTAINTTLSTFGSSGAVMNPIITDTALLAAIQNIDLTGGSGVTPWTYAAPISQPSTFPAIMGSYSTSGMIYNYYTMVQGFIASYVNIATQIDTFLSGSNDIQTGASQMITYLGDLQNNFDLLINIDSKVGIDMSSFQATGSMVINLFYGLLIGLCSLAILGAILMACCESYKCRYLMYLICGVMFLIMGVGFLVATLLSAVIPATIWGCDYLNASISSSANFDYNFRKVDGTAASYLKICMPFGNGDILTQISTDIGYPGFSSLHDLQSVITDFLTYDATTASNTLTDARSLAIQLIGSYLIGVKSDLSDNSYLETFSDPTTQTCDGATFLQDSYLPSTSQDPEYVSCKVTDGVDCNIGNYAANACGGCIDLSLLFAPPAFTYSPGSIVAAVNTRYAPQTTCTVFGTSLENLWVNYFISKYSNIYPIYSNIFTGGNALETATNNFVNAGGYLPNFATAISAANSSLSTVQSLLDPKYGLIGGLNCKVLGQDFQRIVNSLCGDMYSSLWANRLAIGISCFGLLFGSCCIVCSGSRHFRQSIKKSRVSNLDTTTKSKAKLGEREEVTLETINGFDDVDK